ncbi:hypothetical protein Tco_0785009 [Tanacetum coccineum]
MGQDEREGEGCRDVGTRWGVGSVGRSSETENARRRVGVWGGDEGVSRGGSYGRAHEGVKRGLGRWQGVEGCGQVGGWGAHLVAWGGKRVVRRDGVEGIIRVCRRGVGDKGLRVRELNAANMYMGIDRIVYMVGVTYVGFATPFDALGVYVRLFLSPFPENIGNQWSHRIDVTRRMLWLGTEGGRKFCEPTVPFLWAGSSSRKFLPFFWLAPPMEPRIGFPEAPVVLGGAVVSFAVRRVFIYVPQALLHVLVTLRIVKLGPASTPVSLLCLARSQAKSKELGTKSRTRRSGQKETSSDSDYEEDLEDTYEDLSTPYKRPKPTPFTTRITRFKYYRRDKLLRKIKVYEGSKDLEDHLGIFSAATE